MTSSRSSTLTFAPEINAARWFNTDQPLRLQDLRGQVVMLHAFQMLCPGCVTYGIPQASKVATLYRDQPLQVIGLHTVFEHHQVMNADALQVFLREYRIGFPVAIDQPVEIGPIPATMQRYQLQGTPSVVLIDKQGYLRLHHFGPMEDLQLGDQLGRLLAEA
ncbi:TlpA family protein disulfide reductase [Motiliproteus coralliicola]|uniref:TlpA family protein disulfide reductase n=1 Tax=Motiliproteus coralliicola TaxID=2283196 RepID=A0A369WU20_9GAMM|nr:redoxin domain-containing protein [Motiliproteus coralliicola]RDE24046.1 TlpA family protein disulfide reductase [Motiliproteus coralliicola]